MSTQSSILSTTREVHKQLTTEFDRQVLNLVQIGYPKLLGIPATKFIAALEPLRERLPSIEQRADRQPFVIVVPAVSAEQAIRLVELKGKPGFTTMDAADLACFQPIDGVETPAAIAYLMTDVDTGKALLNVTPDEALKSIKRARRSPLTLHDGIALVTQFPDALKTRNSFSMLGSRCGDRRVTALWVSGGSPRLGWCWAGNPHTWLGSASCSGRVAA